MGARAERPKNRMIRVVGGGTRWTREKNAGAKGGSMKAARRLARKQEKAQKKRRKIR